MRLMVMAALRAATMAVTIHNSCCQEGQPCQVKRAANNAPVSANGNANTECSNLIIARTVRMRLLIGVTFTPWLLSRWLSRSSGTLRLAAIPFAPTRDRHIAPRDHRSFSDGDRRRESRA